MMRVGRLVLLLSLVASLTGACVDRRDFDDGAAPSAPEPAAFVADDAPTSTVARPPSSQMAAASSTTAAIETTNSTTSVAAEPTTAPPAPSLSDADIAALEAELDEIDALLRDIDVAMTED